MYLEERLMREVEWPEGELPFLHTAGKLLNVADPHDYIQEAEDGLDVQLATLKERRLRAAAWECRTLKALYAVVDEAAQGIDVWGALQGTFEGAEKQVRLLMAKKAEQDARNLSMQKAAWARKVKAEEKRARQNARNLELQKQAWAAKQARNNVVVVGERKWLVRNPDKHNKWVFSPTERDLWVARGYQVVVEAPTAKV